MLIFTNCLSDTADEGCLKTANSLIKRIKEASSDVNVVSYERNTALSDVYVKSNKLLLTKEIISVLANNKKQVLYIPFPARSVATALRLFVACVLSRGNLSVLLTQVTDISPAAKALFKLSGARFIVISSDTQKKLEKAVGKNRVKRIKVGVDTNRFAPVSPEIAAEIKKSFGFSAEKPLILHVGHLQKGRNVEQLMKIPPNYQALLVTSSLTKNEQDLQLREKLASCTNIKIIDNYIPEIQQVYQMCDAYFFPVNSEGSCIDSPLSCFEAAACGKPVVTTNFGEMKEFKEKNGFYFIESFEREALISLIDKAVSGKADTRSAVLDYDWSKAVKDLM